MKTDWLNENFELCATKTTFCAGLLLALQCLVLKFAASHMIMRRFKHAKSPVEALRD